MEETGSVRGGVNKSRRYLLGAIPVAALAVAACGSEKSDDSAMQDEPPPPRPSTPEDAIQVLMDGNERFQKREPQIRSTAQIDAIWGEITHSQAPFAMVLGCADSRLAPEVLFDQFVGDVFVVREAGNIAVSATNLGSLEFGHAVLKAKALVVLGHSSCGAVDAAFTNATPGGNIQSIVDAIKPGIVGASDLDDAIVRNVRATIDTVRKDSKLLADAEKSGALKIAGAVYDIKTSTVRLI
ncbi:carbonic anhydrase [Mycolicibacterium cyprinidarum]|uniref:carbonic anhydrase n=1 Tax=Mycolicibacterium cyprinidarum TaxID=2860311 RepID=A0ABQ4V5J1_9MYCO|nr:carbonic anhydrase [Mycolicibacterium sp. NGTWS0302]GJF10522.1 carbonic anhydrase [Mycolicibacterium sp. NGTWSNA01]GJF18240.1 carbonic anhydrase [Mycolicibacterium sp. NGTWS1803]